MQLDAFRKATVKGVATRVGGADVKKLKIELARAMGERCVDALLKKGASVDSIRMSNRALVYVVDGVPLFFDPSGGRYEMFPTVYALWALGDAHALARVETHSEVSPKVLGGADLMLPGVTSDVSAWTENELAAALRDRERHSVRGRRDRVRRRARGCERDEGRRRAARARVRRRGVGVGGQIGALRGVLAREDLQDGRSGAGDAGFDFGGGQGARDGGGGAWRDGVGVRRRQARKRKKRTT